MAPPAIHLPTLSSHLGAHARRLAIDILPQCGSTNAILLARAEAGAPSGSTVVALEQTSGRGRRGRTWISSIGNSLTFSMLWRFPADTAIAGLSLAVGVAVARALEKVGADATAAPSGSPSPAIRLKWPNDLLQDGKKLGGILIELVPGNRNAAVIGIGVNLRSSLNLPEELRATATALSRAIDSNTILASLLKELVDTMDRFARGGFAALRAEWLQRHAFQDAPVRLLSDFAAAREGYCRGVDDDGALLFDGDNGLERILSGEISLRAAT